MYSSLKPWMTCPVTVKPYEGLNAAGDKQYGDMSGNQVTSTTQIYYDPADYTINPEDRILVENQEKDIISIATWYDGNSGSASIKLVYL